MRLSSLDHDAIHKYIESLENEAKALKTELLNMCWFMRGGITYDEAMLLSNEDRKIINDITKANIETVKKTGLPLL